MKIRPVQNDAPKQAMIMGEPHMLAYINEAERQMLKRAGGAEAPSFAGIPAYWELFKPSTWGDGKGYQGTGLGNSSNNNQSAGPNIDGTAGYTVGNTGNATTSDGGKISDAGKTITYDNGNALTDRKSVV